MTNAINQTKSMKHHQATFHDIAKLFHISKLTQRAGLKIHYFNRRQVSDNKHDNLCSLLEVPLPDQISLDVGSFLGEDSKEWPTRKKEKHQAKIQFQSIMITSL